VFTRSLPVVGASINLSMRFRSTEEGRNLCVKMIGEVVRVELPLEREASWGFAVAFKTIALKSERCPCEK
jgi:hypothetical protein